MKKLMNRAGLLAAAFALALAVALALNAARQTPATAQVPAATHTPTATQTPEAGANASVVGSDTDYNGLIEITTPAQLNAMRWDLNGNGDPDITVSLANQATYNTLLDCPPRTDECKGYELKSDISLASYQNWEPIGPWQAVFDGNGFSITGLKGQHGLFGHIGVKGADAENAKTVVKNVDVAGAVITPRDDQGGEVGVLAAVNRATIIGSYVTGELTRTSESDHDIGGLVATNRGKIYASVANVDVKVTNIPTGDRVRVGGFAGVNHGDIHRSYAYGDVIDARADEDRDPLKTTNPGRFDARGFAVNHSGHRGTIASSISYGDKIVTDGDLEDAAVLEKSPAKFAYGPAAHDLTPDSCALPDESQFTCPTPTPTPTPTN